jgi:ATP-dependent helicase/nuclease subunit B
MPFVTTTLPWTRPLLSQAVDFLCRGCGEGQAWDLSATLVIVPTGASGRRLRQALAAKAAEKGKGLLSPRIETPDWLVKRETPPSFASPCDLLAAWTALLMRSPDEALSSLLPVAAPKRDSAWALGLARQLLRLQTQLAEYGLDFHKVADRVRESDFEPERWQALASLEATLRARLAERGISDPSENLAERVAASKAPAEFDRIVIACVSDPIALSLEVLKAWSLENRIDVLVHGDPRNPVHDEYGRANPAALESRDLPLDPSFSSLRVVKGPEELARLLQRLASSYGSAERRLGLCLADPRLVGHASSAFEDASLPVHDPVGYPLAKSAVGRLCRALGLLALDDRPETVAILLRDPLFDHFARDETWETNSSELLRAFDRLRAEHFPSRLVECLSFAKSDEKAGLVLALNWIGQAKQRLSGPRICATMEGLLASVFSHGLPSSFACETEQIEASVLALQSVLGDMALAEERQGSLPPEVWLRLLEDQLAEHHLYAPREEQAWTLQGWLELAYEDAPHLALAGLNEGIVPESMHGDLFLPDALRRHLGLPGGAERLARDRLLLEGALRSRMETGRVDILVPKVSSDGEPLQPSRLLFACSDPELIARAKLLFSPAPVQSQAPARRVAWKLSPPAGKQAPPSALNLSASAIRSYLDCPFRYYLENKLGLRRQETLKRDMDAMEFGTLVHAALEQLARDKAMRDIDDETMLADYLVVALNEATAAKLGQIKSFALRIQVEAAAARLRAVAGVEASLRREGWRTREVEWQWNITLGGYAFNGRIDRIDVHADGRWRILDYKTGDLGHAPWETHLASRPKDFSWLLPEALVEIEGKARRWTDLQLPLYLLALRQELGNEARAGYFLIPRTKEDCAVVEWTELSRELIDQAECCAIAVAKAIEAGRFWPPAPSPRWRDEIGRLFPDGVETDFDSSLLQEKQGGLVK